MLRRGLALTVGLMGFVVVQSATLLRADILNFTITGGSLTLSGNSTVAAVPPTFPGGTFNYAQQGAGSLVSPYTGSFTVDVNNVLSPTAIIFNSANVDASVTGTWTPTDGGTAAGPGGPADYGITVAEIAASGKLRNIVFNVAGASAPVAGGNFSVANQSWSYTSGILDVFSGALNAGNTIALTGAANNSNATLGNYSVAGNTITMTVPVTISLPYTIQGTPLVTGFNNYTGTITAIAAVPEPSSMALVALCGTTLFFRRRWARKAC